MERRGFDVRKEGPAPWLLVDK